MIACPWQSSYVHIVDTTSGELRAPQMGEVFKNPGLANVFRSVATNGKDGFYKGWVAEAIVKVLKQHDGAMSLNDLKMHTSTLVEPICIEYKGMLCYLRMCIV